MGNQNIYTNEVNNFYLPRYTTVVPINSATADMAEKIQFLGFTIEDFDDEQMRVTLPYHWTHFEVSDEQEVIVDVLGRIRVVIDPHRNKMELLRRFGYAINHVNIPDKKVSGMQCFITDMNKPVTQIDINPQQYQQYLDEAGGSVDNLLNICITQCQNILDKEFPDWRNELAYWNE